MKSICKTFLGISLTAGSLASASPIVGLWNTGVDDNGTPLGVGMAESHYETVLPLSANPNYVVLTVNLPGVYAQNPSDAAWIGPALTANEGALADDPVGTYTYTIRFSLDGQDASTAVVEGAWASDNNSSIWLNGVDTGLSVPFEGFRSLKAFNLFDGMLGKDGAPIEFNGGENTLEFLVTNGSGSGNPSALLVSGLSGTATEYSVPDRSSTFILFGGGLLMMMVLHPLRRV